MRRRGDRERGRDTGRGRSRLHAGSPTWDSIPGLQDPPRAEGGAKPLSHRDCPEINKILKRKKKKKNTSRINFYCQILFYFL